MSRAFFRRHQGPQRRVPSRFDFEEVKHERDETGKFKPKGGAGDTAKGKPSAMTKDDFLDQQGEMEFDEVAEVLNEHKGSVFTDIIDGNVPAPEVMKDYPDLQKFAEGRGKAPHEMDFETYRWNFVEHGTTKKAAALIQEDGLTSGWADVPQPNPKDVSISAHKFGEVVLVFDKADVIPEEVDELFLKPGAKPIAVLPAGENTHTQLVRRAKEGK